MEFPVVLKKVCGNFRVSAIKKEVEFPWVQGVSSQFCRISRVESQNF